MIFLNTLFKVINDANLKCLFKIFSLITSLDNKLIVSDSARAFRNAKKLWCKMCRLSANLCQDKSSIKVKNLFTNGLCLIYLEIFFIIL